jgi:hypothetical protein
VIFTFPATRNHTKDRKRGEAFVCEPSPPGHASENVIALEILAHVQRSLHAPLLVAPAKTNRSRVTDFVTLGRHGALGSVPVARVLVEREATTATRWLCNSIADLS